MDVCSKLPGRLRDICEGSSGLSEAKRLAYIRQWVADGRLPSDALDLLATARKHSGPSVARRIANATEAAGRVAMAAVKAEPIKASPEIIAARNAVCEACPSRDGQWCQERKCGCFLPLKSTLATETCPLGKWPLG